MKQGTAAPRIGRIIEVDIAKGLGILSVILYHTLPTCALHTALGGYMMPLFFVASGLVMQKDGGRFSPRRFWEKNARLLFYYILFSAIYLLCSAVTCLAGSGSYKALALDGIGGAALTVCCGLLAQVAPQDMHYLTASRPLLSLAATALGCAGILGISLALGKVPMANKGLAYLGVHSLYLMAIHNQPNLYGWLNKLSVKLCAGLPGWYVQGMFFLLLTVAALMIAMGLEPRLDPAVRALARRCTGQAKDQTNPERS